MSRISQRDASDGDTRRERLKEFAIDDFFIISVDSSISPSCSPINGSDGCLSTSSGRSCNRCIGAFSSAHGATHLDAIGTADDSRDTDLGDLFDGSIIGIEEDTCVRTDKFISSFGCGTFTADNLETDSSSTTETTSELRGSIE